MCGGALLNRYYVVTVAQCWYDGESEGREMQVSKDKPFSSIRFLKGTFERHTKIKEFARVVSYGEELGKKLYQQN